MVLLISHSLFFLSFFAFSLYYSLYTPRDGDCHTRCFTVELCAYRCASRTIAHVLFALSSLRSTKQYNVITTDHFCFIGVTMWLCLHDTRNKQYTRDRDRCSAGSRTSGILVKSNWSSNTRVDIEFTCASFCLLVILWFVSFNVFLLLQAHILDRSLSQINKFRLG